MATAIALCLLIGAVGKSAQMPLYTWLPDAMEGPTPVSALIHAATMVTAGVYMIVRNHAIYDWRPTAMTRWRGSAAVTALFAATIGLVQNDIKTSAGLFDREPVGLHVSGLRCGRLCGRRFFT